MRDRASDTPTPPKPARSGPWPPAAVLFLLVLLGLAAVHPAIAAPPAGFTIPADLGSHAILSCGELKIAGSSVVTSQGLGTGSSGAGQAHVRSNADVVLDGTIEVHGDAIAGPGHSVRVSGQPLVSGERRSAPAPYPCAPIDLAAVRAALEADNDNSQLPATEKGKPALSGAAGRTLDLSGKDSLTLPAGSYLFDEIRLSGNSRVRVEGPVQILVTGPIDVKGGSHLNLDGNPYQLRLWTSGGSVSIASQSNVFGFLYAPAAAVLLSGQSRIAGGVQGDQVELVGGSRVRRVVDDTPPVLTVTTPVDGQSVTVCEIPVTGTVRDGESPVELTVNGLPVTPDADGAFATTTSLWTADPGLVEVVATDRGGNVTRVAVRVAIVPPTVALVSPAPGSLVGHRAVDLAGSSGTATEVTVNGQPAVVAGDGSWHLSGFDLGEQDGLVTLALASRHCGGSAAATAVLDLDTLPPVVAIDSPASGSLFGAGPITVSGPVADAHLAGVSVNGIAAVVAGGRFTVEVALVEGSNQLVARAVDELGHSSTSAPVTVELDTSVPAVTITAPASGTVVATPQIAVSGLAAARNLARVTVAGVVAALEPVEEGALFSATVPLVEGNNFLVATATDLLERSSESPSVVVVLDTQPPVVTLDAAALPALTADETVTVTGTVDEPHLESVTVNGVAATVSGSGWVAAGVPLVEGTNALVARAVDTLGHAAETAPATVVRDTLPPQVAVTEPEAGAQLTSRTVTVRGTAVDPHLEKVTVSGIEATVTGESFEAVGVELSEGESEIVARATDALGQAASSAPVPVVVDTLPPVVRLDSPQDPLVATPLVDLTGTVEEPHLAEVSVRDLVATVADGKFSVAAVPLVEGVNELVAVARDTFGHEATSEPVLYVLDTVAPELAITTPVAGEVVRDLVVTVSGTVTDTHLDTVMVGDVEATLDEVAGTFTATVTLQEGANTLVVAALDRAGNRAEVSLAVTVVLDSEPPLLTLDEPALAPGACLPAGAPRTLGGVYRDDNPPAAEPGAAPVAVEVVDASGARRNYGGTLDLAGGRWSASGVDLGSADGVVQVRVTAADAYGNRGSLVASLRIDSAAPVVRLLLDGAPFPGAGPGAVPPPGATPTLIGRQITAAAAVEDGGAAAPPAATLTLDGAAYAAGTPIVAEGQHLLVATATDCAGHTTATHALVALDTTPPALRSTTPAQGARLTTAPTALSGLSDPDLARATVAGRPATVGGNGAFSLTPFPWKEGRNEVAIELEDRAGHRSTHTVAFEVKTVPLTLQLLEGGAPIAAGAVFLRPVRPEARPSDSTASVSATLNGAPFLSGSEIAQGGTYTLAATASDDWGRTAAAQVSFTVDLAPGPQVAITAPADGAVLAAAQARVTGTVTGEGAAVTVNGVAAVVSGPTTSGATWEVASLPLEPDAMTPIVAIARDSRGRTASDGVTVAVASGAPQVLLLEPAAGTTTNRSRIDVAGVVVGGAARSADGTVTVAGTVAGSSRSVTLAPDGTFRATDVPLATGANTLTATVTDSDSRSGSAAVTVTADFTPPTIAFLVAGQPLLDGATFGGPIALVVEVTDDAALAAPPRIRLNGAPHDGAALPRTEIAFADSGGYVVAVSVLDAAGNEARAERSFVLSAGGCSLSDVAPPAGSGVAGSSVTLVGRAGAAATVKVRVPQPGGGVQEYAAALADGTFLAGDVPLPVVGSNALELVCLGSGGGSSSAPHPIERLAAGAGPTITIGAPLSGALVAAAAIPVAGTVSSGVVAVNGLSAVVTPVSGGGNTFQVAAVPLAEGPNPLLARVVDAAGRSGEDRVVVDRDSQAPRLQITRPDNRTKVGVAGGGPATIAVSGAVDLSSEPHLDRVVVTSSVAGSVLGSVVATVDPATGTFLAQGVPLDAAAGAAVEQTLTATATDTLGHAGSSSVVVTLDAAGPAIVLTEPADLLRLAAGSTGPIAVAGEAWGAPGTAVSVNGVDLDPATLAWEAPAADGRRRVAFSASINLPLTDGPFGVIARATDLEGRLAQDRRLLYRDTQGPRVLEMIPTDGSTGVDGNGLLLVLFSEPIRHDSLEAADGLTLVRTSIGQPVVGSKTVAGQAVAFAPGAALAPGEAYRFRAGVGITDLAGNPLVAPAESAFTVATSRAAAAPVLAPLPASLCVSELAVSGTAAPSATLKVRLAGLVFTGFADATGAFTVTVPVAGNGYQLLAVWALDPVTGEKSPESTAVVRIDCQAPGVVEARFDRTTGVVRIAFSEAMGAATLGVGGADAAIRLADADAPTAYQAGVLSLPDDATALVQLDTAPAAWWRDRPVRLLVGPPAADAEGNPMAAVFETVFFPGGGDLAGGFLFGEAYDDTTGRPLAGAAVGLYPAGVALPGTVPVGEEGAPLFGAMTDGRGRFVLTGELPAGRYALLVAGRDTNQVYRRLSLRPATGEVPFDSRLTPLATPAGTIAPAVGGAVESAGVAGVEGGAGGSGGSGSVSGTLRFVADPAALPGSEPVTVVLTRLSEQGLPDFLPLGWTPAAAAELRLEQAAASGQPALALPEQALWTSGLARLELPLPAWAGPDAELYAARYEAATGRWLGLPLPERLAPAVAGGPARARIDLLGPGTVALVVADADAASRPPALPGDGEPLVGVERPASVPELEATLTLDPPVVGPTGRARARVVARSADGSTPWPSGLAVQAYLEERLVLTGGGELLEAPFAADLVLYHSGLSVGELGTAAEAAAGAMELAVSPSPRAAQVLLEVGWENIRVFPFPEEVERGPAVGPDGGTVDTSEGVVLTIPEGALTSKVPVSVALLSAAELAALPAVAGYDTVAAVRIDLSGAALNRAASLSLPTPAATPSDSPAEPRVVLAELVVAPIDGRGAFAEVVSRTQRQGSGAAERVVASPDYAGALPLDGILREGVYLVLAAHQPLGFATGFVRGGNDVPVAASRVTADGLGTADLSAPTGRYAVAVPAGQQRRVVARHPALDERAEGTIPDLPAGAVVALDLSLAVVPPRVLSTSPVDGATEVPLATAVSVLFSEPLDPATVTSSALRLELAGAAGEPTGVFVDGSVGLLDGVRVVFTPSRPLLPGRRFRALLGGGVADTGGAIYAGGPLLWSFATSTAIVPGGQVDPTKFHVRVPVNGVAEIYGEAGALPGALPGQTPWAVSPEIEGPVADPQRDTFQGRSDGSFTGTVGHPPDFAVTLESRIWVKVFDPTGALAAEFRVGPFTTPDGLGFVAPAGEAVTFRSAQGHVVDVPAGAFDSATLVRVENLNPATVGVATPPGLGLGGYVRVDFDGEARETLRVHVPAPAGVADGAQVFVGAPEHFPWGPALRFLTTGGVLHRDGQRFLSNDPSLQPEPAPGTFSGLSSATARSMTLAESSSGQTCQQAQESGLPRCFLQELLVEFRRAADAAWYYEQGKQWTLLAGPAGGLVDAWGQAVAGILAGAFVYTPGPSDSGGRYVLPVPVGERFEVVERDLAKGWVRHRRDVDAILADDGFAIVPLVADDEQRPPMLIDARPFHLVRFAAPREGEQLPVRLEVQVKGLEGDKVSLQPSPEAPLPDGSTLQLFDVLPPSLETEDERYGAPIEGPSARVCGGAPWSLAPFAGSNQMLLVVSPGDVEPSGGVFELQLDRALREIPAGNTAATLLDLGPKEHCGGSPSGYPRSVPVEVNLASQNTRLVIVPQGPLPGGHRFQLELRTAALVAADTGLGAWETMPRRFEFATRGAAGTPIGGLPIDSPLGPDAPAARDILQLGHLMLVAADNGELVAFDVSRPTDEAGFRRHARFSKGLQGAARTLATDGHGRVFWSGLFGSLWALKALRIEDVRAASGACAGAPEWAADTPCFPAQIGAIRIANTLGSSDLTPSEWLASGPLPSGTPMDLDLLVLDEEGSTLGLEDFYRIYTGGTLTSLTPDSRGVYDFAVPLSSTLARGGVEPSRPPGSPPVATVEAWRERVCTGEEPHDRYQRVSVDNLTTGESFSFDIENPWPDGGAGNGSATLSGVKARRGDRLRVRYNLRALGYVAIMGSGVTVVDLNRAYRLPSPGGGLGDYLAAKQCGRRLGQFEGASLEFPSCATQLGSGPEGLSLTPSLAVQAETGCEGGNCRGQGLLEVYSPLINVGVVHARTTADRPAGLGQAGSEIAACLHRVAGEKVFLRDIDLANDVEWLDYGLRGRFDGAFVNDRPGQPPVKERGDLAFVTLGTPGVFVFDVSDRFLQQSTLVGHLRVPGHTAFRVQVDRAAGLVFVGGTDTRATPPAPVVDVFDLRFVGAAPGTSFDPRPLASLRAPWATGNLGIDAAGSGLIYTWDAEGVSPVALPFEPPQIVTAGIYRPEDAPPGPVEPETRPASSFDPLGIPLEHSGEKERALRDENEAKATPAFKVRVALPGSLGDALLARVQSLTVLPSRHLLGREDLGAAASPPGGPGWPEPSVTVTLRRLSADGGSSAFNLYESDETVLLIADPRASRAYRRQEVAGSEADEESQCRRCEWPSYLPDPSGTSPELSRIKELLAGGPHVRVFLFEDPAAALPVRTATREAIAFFGGQGEAYPLPAGAAELSGFADAVPSPVQVSLAEPAQNAAVWPGPAGIAVALTGGEALLSTVDHAVAGRALPVTFDRSYRSHTLGYGPLGSAGWSSGLFAHLRELKRTGEVLYHDGWGAVWRFLPKVVDGRPIPRPPTHQNDFSAGGSYHPPLGLYLRLVKTGFGWRMLDRQGNELRFDRQGRLFERSDRHRQGGDPERAGSTMRYLYDAFGRLRTIEDDLGRRYRLEYHDNPQTDGPRYGLLRRIVDFAGREVEYEWSEERLLERVLLPEVDNSQFPELSFQGGSRPQVEYSYGPAQGVNASSQPAMLHGDFAPLRLEGLRLPAYLADGSRPLRVELGYDAATGRLVTVQEPGTQPWKLTFPAQPSSAAPATRARVEAPWGHAVDFELDEGRVAAMREMLPVQGDEGGSTLLQVVTSYSYTGDGRVGSVGHPDGAKDFWCYVDNQGEECPGGGPIAVDLLAKLNLLNVGRSVPEGAARGTATYDRIAPREIEYNEDNLPHRVVDPAGREIEMPVATVEAPEGRGGEAVERIDYPEKPEGPSEVGSTVQFDRFGRPTERTGGGAAAPTTELRYGSDRRGRSEAGFVEHVAQGELSLDLTHDDRGNLRHRTTSWGVSDRFEHDAWDRVVFEETGIPGGAYAAPGACGGGGAKVWRGFDAAGHLVVERRLQDHVTSSGEATCREVTTRYRYDAREQLIAVEQTHVASSTPGLVNSDSWELVRHVYDARGLLVETRLRNAVDPHLVTTYTYDAAGRVASEQSGASAARGVGYDVKGRLVFEHDGDQGVVRRQFDGWDRPWREELPTGAVVVRTWDAAGQTTSEKVTDGAGETVLAETRTVHTAFGEVASTVEVLSRTAGAGGELSEEVRRTAYLYDGSGRLEEVWGGEGAEVFVGPIRKLATYAYEAGTGRLLAEAGGGEFFQQGLFERHYRYSDAAPWPSTVEEREALPGGGVVPTLTHSFQRDSFGRPVRQSANDGSLLMTRYDRAGEAIGWETGAGTRWGVSLDSLGRVVSELRPLGQGESRFGYDLDGRLLSEERDFSGGVWTTRSTYDSSGRLANLLHPNGTSESWTYNGDDTPATWRTQDGVTVAIGYDAANRPTSMTPTAGGAVSVQLDGGDRLAYDPLSRPVLSERSGGAEKVATPRWDLGGRLLEERVGARGALVRSYDAFDNPLRTEMPAASVAPAGGMLGWSRSFDTQDRPETVGPLGSARAAGASWSWGGAGRLYAATGSGPVQTEVRFGYHGGAGPASSAPEASAWRLGAVEWGSAGGASWGAFGVGWRGADGAKLSRPGGTGPTAGMGWSYGYDAGVRLAEAGSAADRWGFGFGTGDERLHESRAVAGDLALFAVGPDGRIAARDGVEYGYDLSGRRTGDDRYDYTWSWRGELVAMTVKDAWPDADGDGEPERPAFAGHQVRLAYDATGRLLTKEHRGRRPEGGTDEERPFVELREYVWEGQGLATEIAWGAPDRTQPRWRRTYVPGPSGVDDAVQVVVEIEPTFPGSPLAGSTRLYSFVADEMGTVVALVAEEETTDPARPVIPVRYLYTPFGEVHAETGPEPREGQLDNGREEAAGVQQSIADRRLAATGALIVEWSIGLDAASLGSGVAVERLVSGSGWLQLLPEQVVVVLENGAAEAGRVVVMPVSGWSAATSYRVRFQPELRDSLGRSFGRTESLEWRVPDAPPPPAEGEEPQPVPPIHFEKKYPLRFESFEAARNTLGGRFPGGQSALFHGAYVDEVTGLVHLRARWLDTRNGSFLTPDPAGAVDSTNLYAYAAWAPNMYSDPLGMCIGPLRDLTCEEAAESFNSFSLGFWKRTGAFAGGEVMGLVELPGDLVDAIVNYDETVGGVAELWANRDRVDFGALAGQMVDDYVNSSSYDQGRGFGKTVLPTVATLGAGPAMAGSRAAVAAGEAGALLRGTVGAIDAVQGLATAARSRALGAAGGYAARFAEGLAVAEPGTHLGSIGANTLQNLYAASRYARLTAGRHHFVPRALGSPLRYGHRSLTDLSDVSHSVIQGALNAHLGKITRTLPTGRVVSMRPMTGNPGALVRRVFSARERTAALDDFYKGFAGGRYYPAFRMELNATIKAGGLR